MSDDKLSRLKKEALLLEQLLTKKAASINDAKTALDQLSEIFKKIKSMSSYQIIGRIRLDYLFIEGELANNNELADCYSRFGNLAEGLEV